MRLVTGLIVMIICLGLDQLSKGYMLESLGMNHRPPIEIAPFFNLVMVWNSGVSFGMFAAAKQPLALIFLSAAILVILLVWLARTPSMLVAVALGCVMGGAIGNVIDRLRFGAVADFFDFHLGAYHWPAFNIADSAIFIGIVLLCLHSMLSSAKKEGSP
jgi:signal peptidase II